jgi:adenosylhomocysteine nucleosidase
MIPVMIALNAELPDELPEPYVKCVMGVGKIKATIATMKAIQKYRPTRLINYGTAGSLNRDFSEGIYQIAVVGQRDMDVRALGCKLGETPYSKEHWITLSDVETRPTLTSGDSFVSFVPELKSDLVDMEAYAIAMVCRDQKVPLDVYKFVSDNADAEAPRTWEENVNAGSVEFIRLLKSLENTV